jgi:secondary thiamine-phosphate synthase enzyme
MFQELAVRTTRQVEFLDITERLAQEVKKSGIQEGLCYVFVPHTTAGITINENADPSVVSDIIKELNKIVPWDDRYSHLEGNSPAHIKASMVGFSLTLIIEKGRLALGTWQGIYFCEFDGPRNRKVQVKIFEA